MIEDSNAWEKFLHVLDWVLAVQARYATDLRHSLVRIRFHDQRALGDAYGARDALTMLMRLAAQLQHSLRKTDLVARNGTDIWVLIPFVTPESVLSKVSQIVSIASTNGLDIVDRDLSVFTIPDADGLEKLAFDNAERFLGVIGTESQITMRWEGAR
jgi:GGDEF domain-containing protein